jgi:diguanylate cyclase (GGDEF)-like protein
MLSTPALSLSQVRRFLALFLLVGVVYFTVDFTLNRIGFTEGWTILWPLNGISIGILLMQPRSRWPAILLGIGVGTGIGECLDNNAIPFEIVERLISLTEVILATLCLPAFESLDLWLREPAIFRRFATAMVVGPGASGILFALFVNGFHSENFMGSFREWAVSDTLGIGVMLPLTLAFRSPEMIDLFRPRALPKTLGFLALATVVFATSLSERRYPVLFLLYPTLLLVDLVLSFAGSCIAVAIMCFLAIILTINGQGLYGHWDPTVAISRDLGLQIFLGFHILALFPASVILRERRRLLAELNDSNAQLLRIASRDALTGLFNRRAFDEQLDQEWKRALRLKTPIALIMMDVDHFKQFNDLYGHASGDDCLRAVANAISGHSRRAQDHLARYGGEEFVLILPHTDLDGARHCAEAIRIAISNLNLPHESSGWKRVTLSLGCASIDPSDDTSPDTLIRLADSALYNAKRSGRNITQVSEGPEAHMS